MPSVPSKYTFYYERLIGEVQLRFLRIPFSSIKSKYLLKKTGYVDERYARSSK